MGRGGRGDADTGVQAARGRGQRLAARLDALADRELGQALGAALAHLHRDDLFMIEALAAAAEDPEARRLTDALRGEPGERHAELARVGGRRPEAIMVVASEETMKQICERPVALGGELLPLGVSLDLPSGESVVAVAPAEAERALRGEVSATLVHELIHATQSQRGFPYTFSDPTEQALAEQAAELICEGTTEALTELRVGEVDGTYVVERAAIAEILAGEEDLEDALEELSGEEWDLRLAVVAERLFGDDQQQPAVEDLCAEYRRRALELEVNDPRARDSARRGELEPQLRRIMRELIEQARAGQRAA